MSHCYLFYFPAPILGCESFYVPVIDDDIYEDTQIFELVLRSDSSHILVDDSSVFSIYIEDNDSKWRQQL